MNRLRRETEELVLNRLHLELAEHEMPALLRQEASNQHDDMPSALHPTSWWSGIGLFVAFMACISIWLITVFGPMESRRAITDGHRPVIHGWTHHRPIQRVPGPIWQKENTLKMGNSK